MTNDGRTTRKEANPSQRGGVIVDFEPFSDGFEIMRDAQSAQPQAFKTGDGWFAFNLATNLA